MDNLSPSVEGNLPCSVEEGSSYGTFVLCKVVGVELKVIVSMGKALGTRLSMGWWLLRLTANVLGFLLLTDNFVPLRLTDVLKINFHCFKKVKN